MTGRQILVVTALALNEPLRRDNVAEVSSEFERVVTLQPGQIVNDLVIVLNPELREVAVRANFQSEIE